MAATRRDRRRHGLSGDPTGVVTGVYENARLNESRGLDRDRLVFGTIVEFWPLNRNVCNALRNALPVLTEVL